MFEIREVLSLFNKSMKEKEQSWSQMYDKNLKKSNIDKEENIIF